jgi:WhiB family redox-sensing transcriptional regulator
MDDFEFLDFPDFISKGEPNCSEAEADMFFADYEGPNFTQLLNSARRVCIGCPYKLECLTYAVENNMDGVWGGTSEGERRRMKETKIIELLDDDRIGVRMTKDEKPVAYNKKKVA